MPAIDITIVAARRPALLAHTLESFHKHLFRHFEIAQAFINIDPVWGDQSAAEECAAIGRKLFNNPTIFTPTSRGFCAAVKRVWTNTNADFIFHLEDDWLLNEHITPTILDQFKDASIAQVSLMSKEKNWDRTIRGDFHYVKRRKPLVAGLKWPIRTKVTAFTTSPSFIRGDFVRKWASMLNENLDPEKQGYMGTNKTLERFMKPFRNYIYSGAQNEIVITDTGREWRESQNIEKKIVAGASVWTPKS